MEGRVEKVLFVLVIKARGIFRDEAITATKRLVAECATWFNTSRKISSF